MCGHFCDFHQIVVFNGLFFHRGLLSPLSSFYSGRRWKWRVAHWHIVVVLWGEICIVVVLSSESWSDTDRRTAATGFHAVS